MLAEITRRAGSAYEDYHAKYSKIKKQQRKKGRAERRVSVISPESLFFGKNFWYRVMLCILAVYGSIWVSQCYESAPVASETHAACCTSHPSRSRASSRTGTDLPGASRTTRTALAPPLDYAAPQEAEPGGATETQAGISLVPSSIVDSSIWHLARF